MIRPRPSRYTASLPALLILSACAGGTPGPSAGVAEPSDARPEATVVQPGAPGEATRVVDPGEIIERGLPEWTEADADFMAGMIHHHAQALQMTALLDERSTNAGVRQMGLRMEISQRDEIRLMQDWLRTRGLEYPDVVLDDGPMQGVMDHAAMGHDMAGMDQTSGTGGLMAMPGMLSSEQMSRLRAASGEAFDQLFLEYMIQHHAGAITMVQELFSVPGAGQGSKISDFASDVDADQRAEIDRMRMLLARYR